MKSSDSNWLTVIIPSRDRINAVSKQIEILAELKDIYQIIIVDDCSEIPYTVNNQKVKVIRNSVNLGEASSINIAVLNLKTSYFTILSDDDFQSINWILEIRNAIESNVGVAVYVPTTLVVNKSQIVRINPAKNFSKSRTFGLLEPPAFAGAIIDYSLLPDSLRNALRNPGIINSDFFQWLNLGVESKFYSVKNSFAIWQQHPNQQSNYDLNSLAPTQFLQASIDWFNNPNHAKPRIMTYSALVLRYLRMERHGTFVAKLGKALRKIRTLRGYSDLKFFFSIFVFLLFWSANKLKEIIFVLFINISYRNRLMSMKSTINMNSGV